jgi:hypothetical protein
MALCDGKARFPTALLIAISILLIAGFNTRAGAIQVQPVSYDETESIKLPWSLHMILHKKFETPDKDFNGFDLSVTAFLSPRESFRLSLTVGKRNVVYRDDLIFYYYDYAFWFKNTDRHGVNNINLSLQYLLYSDIQPRTRVYVGFGPQVGIYETEMYVVAENIDPENYLGGGINIFNNAIVSLGISGTIGTEVFLNKNISLTAEYSITVENRWYFFSIEQWSHEIAPNGIQYTTSPSHDEVGYRDNMELDAVHVKLGFGFYFL